MRRFAVLPTNSGGSRHNRPMRILAGHTTRVQALAVVVLVLGLSTTLALGVGWLVARGVVGGSGGSTFRAVLLVAAGVSYFAFVPLVVRVLLRPGRRLTLGVLAAVTPLVFGNLTIAVHGLIPVIGLPVSAGLTGVALLVFEVVAVGNSLEASSSSTEDGDFRSGGWARGVDGRGDVREPGAGRRS